MKKLIFAVAIVAVSLTACSNDKTISKAATQGKAMEFRTVTEKSRTAVTDEANMTSFTVNGWWDYDNSNTYGDDTKGTYLFDAFDITRNETGVTDWDYNPKRYWPATGTVDFFAYSPASSINVTKGLLGYSSTDARISYKVPSPAENNPQEDFLVATKFDMTTGAVVLNFQHALSRVRFQAAKNIEDIEYQIEGVSLVNLSSTADLEITSTTNTFPETGGFTYGTTPIIYWAGYNAATTDYAVDFSGSPVSVKYSDPAGTMTYTSIIGATNALMVMPQQTVLGEVYTKATADPATDNIMTPTTGNEDDFYIKVSYKAFQPNGKGGLIYYAGSETACKEMYLPVAVGGNALAFELGRQYTFNLLFGTGSQLGDAISFDVSVQAWDNAGELVVNP